MKEHFEQFLDDGEEFISITQLAVKAKARFVKEQGLDAYTEKCVYIYIYISVSVSVSVSACMSVFLRVPYTPPPSLAHTH